MSPATWDKSRLVFDLGAYCFINPITSVVVVTEDDNVNNIELILSDELLLLLYTQLDIGRRVALKLTASHSYVQILRES